MIDVHCHLHAPEFDPDRSLVLERARRAGVRAVLVVGEGLDDNLRALELARAAPGVHACLGLHPDRYRDFRLEEVVVQIRSFQGEILGIGEVGLDYLRAEEEEQRAAQRAALECLAALAAQLDLPLNVHSRSAGHQTLELLRSTGARRVHMHAFDGRASYAVKAAEEGMFFSLPPTTLRSPQKQKLAARLPLSQLLLESDAPVLGPEPGVRNEPQNLALTLRFLAERRGVREEELREVLRENALRAYPRLRERLGSAPAEPDRR